MLSVRHHEFGAPSEVLRVESLPVPEPGPGEVRVKLLAATINPSDYGMIGGSYGSLRELPAVAGREGVGAVDALGEGVDSVQTGAHVRFPDGGTWQEYACMPAEDLLLVDASVPVEQAAVSFINPPTAFCLLDKIVDLKEGDWIVQNAGNSAVGLSVIQMAKAMGLKTISQVRREELVEPLLAYGADQVVLEGSAWPKKLKELTGGAPVKLALNSIGGESAIDQIKALGDGGTQVTFGGMVADKVRFPTRFLIFNDVRLVGFWWDKFCKTEGADAVLEVMDRVYTMMREGQLKLPIEATYALPQIQEAIQHDKSPKLGKVLLRP
ncbi:zinc-dependent alcohol dehydrogenase family protein [Coraliomargarita sinensis]|nr:zinc-dependent alcohol dehydrogenase family protein [Coraliomargarita sinensis]